MTALAFFGGVYNNAPALAAALDDARKRGADALYALGDFGAYYPYRSGPETLFWLVLYAPS